MTRARPSQDPRPLGAGKTRPASPPPWAAPKVSTGSSAPSRRAGARLRPARRPPDRIGRLRSAAHGTSKRPPPIFQTGISKSRRPRICCVAVRTSRGTPAASRLGAPCAAGATWGSIRFRASPGEVDTAVSGPAPAARPPPPAGKGGRSRSRRSEFLGGTDSRRCRTMRRAARPDPGGPASERSWETLRRSRTRASVRPNSACRRFRASLVLGQSARVTSTIASPPPPNAKLSRPRRPK